MSSQKTLQQRRAALAWEQTESVSKKELSDYASLVRGLPAMIQTDGIGQTLAFLLAKANERPHQRTAYRFLEEWLSVEFENVKPGLIQWLLNSDSDVYRQATNEAQAYLVWLKRFAEAKD